MSAAVQRPRAELPIAPLLSIRDIARIASVSVRTLERERSADRFPKPDLRIGRALRWKPETVRAWIDSNADGRLRRPAG